ncbi:MAG TPA: PPE family protein [Mycobacterium sp.]|nr:PPE family protein [Mycobacterium sp.]
MSFARVPPEINSGRMYYGSGSATMVAAATAWDQLAANLCETAASCRAATSKLAAESGQAASAMGRAIASYLGWLDTAATKAAHAATQAAAAATAYESALAALVPPEVINANRARLSSLATRNCLGQASPIIADADAEYERMWVNDAEAMYAYARACAEASALTPFSTPHLDVDPAYQGAAVTRTSRALTNAPDVIAAGHQVMAAISAALQAMSSSAQTTLDVHLSPVAASLSKLSSLVPAAEVAIKNLDQLNRATMLLHAAAIMSSVNQRTPDGAASTGGVGRGQSIEALSVPQRWIMVTTGSTAKEPQYIGFRQPMHLVHPAGAQLARQADSPQSPDTEPGD